MDCSFIRKRTIPRMHWMELIEDNEAKALQIKPSLNA